MDVLEDSRILVVEDEYLIASEIARALQNSGAQVVGPVSRLPDGLELAESEELDAAVLDINLHNELGYPIARRLTERRVPWVLVTGYDAWAIPPEFQSAPRVTKPFVVAKLLAALAGALGEKAGP